MRIMFFSALALIFGVTHASAIEITVDGEQINVPICGGFVGLQCDLDEWCDYPAETTCAIDDQFGTCRARPEVCTEEYMPVCGCDGKTYGNSCQAAEAGYDVAHAGVCRQQGPEE